MDKTFLNHPASENTLAKLLAAEQARNTVLQQITEHGNMAGASSAAAGKHGLVPAPAAGDQNKFLRGDGTWTTVSFMSLSATSLVLTSGKSKTVTVMRQGDGKVSAKSSNEAVATVSVTDTTVTVTGVSVGSTIIVVSAAADGELTAMSAVLAVTVSIPVFGVCWDMSNSSTALSRLTTDDDPNGYVSVNVTTEPVAAVGTGEGSSLFDDYAPWNGMAEYNIANDGTVTPSTDSAFSRSSGNVMVYIPEFWFKVVNNEANSKRYFYISSGEAEGFDKHPGSGRYVGRYNTASGYVSQTGLAPLVNITREAARTGSTGKGTGWYQYDYATWCAIWLLYLVEYADWDSQSKIGRGFVDNEYEGTSPLNSGGTDSMSYHTGRAEGTDGQTAVQYRHIENPYGNVYDWVDGVNFNAGSVYACTDPANYADDTEENYTNIDTSWAPGYTSYKGGWIKSIGCSATHPWAFYPTAISGGSSSTYIADYAGFYSGWRVLFVGGDWTSGSAAGLFFFGAAYSASSAYASIGARLLFTP